MLFVSNNCNKASSYRNIFECQKPTCLLATINTAEWLNFLNLERLNRLNLNFPRTFQIQPFGRRRERGPAPAAALALAPLPGGVGHHAPLLRGLRARDHHDLLRPRARQLRAATAAAAAGEQQQLEVDGHEAAQHPDLAHQEHCGEEG